MRWLGLALALLGLAAMSVPLTDVDLGALGSYGPPVGLLLAGTGAWLFARSLRGSGLGLSDPRAWRRFKKNKGAIAGAVLVSAVVLVSFVGPLLAPHDPDLIHEAALQESGLPVGPGAEFPLGADSQGRDQLSRLLYGGRVSLAVALGAVLIAGAWGFSAGLVAGYFRRSVDTAVVQLVNFVLSLPFLLVAIALNRVVDDPSLFTLCLLLGALSWTTLARVTRAKTLQVRELAYVEAARALGVTHTRILLRHVVPNVLGPAIVIVTTLVAQLIIAESAMSFLGLGVQPPTASWGSMLRDGQQYLGQDPRLLLLPGALIVMTVFGFNLLGEGLRDALDPKD
ncbi:MAG: ABC transporter permease [Sandaracinaceae bacterium]|nr:ABC transporter permease [Sandaracinaceae bacterium]